MNYTPSNDNQTAMQECVESQADSQTNPKSITAIQDLVECENAKDTKHSQLGCHLGLKQVTSRSKR